MISLELARKLKEAGLEWEPQYGDIMTSMYDGFKDDSYVLDEYLVIDKEFIEDYPALKPDELKEFRKWAIFLPRLDQLLGEIEKRGYSWEMRTVIDESQSVRFNAKNIAYWIHVWKTGHIEWEDGFKRAFTSPSNAAASALLWILEGGTSK